MQKTLKEVAEIVGGEVVGNPDVVITGICSIKEAKPGDITFVVTPKYFSLISHTQASAVITYKEVKDAPKPIIRTENPSLAFAKMVSFLAPNEVKRPQGIHPLAILGKGVQLGEDVAIQAHCVIEDKVSIGDGTIIYAGVYIGHHTKIGSNTIIYPGVSVRERITIGSNVIIHSGSVIGSDGFGFAMVEGIHQRIPQIGTVVIEDDVEIGSNVTIDRARFKETVIGRGTKIDNLVQIAHNVIIGEHSMIVAQAGISGSTQIGKNVTLAGQSGVIGHVTVGDNAIIAGRAGVTKSVDAGVCVSGFPAKPHTLAKRINACVQRLPNLFKTIAGLKQRIEKLEKKSGISKDDN